MDLAQQWGPNKMDIEIDPGWGVLTPISLLLLYVCLVLYPHMVTLIV
jgi:hypothetical protein